jgi:hypothetical protein
MTFDEKRKRKKIKLPNILEGKMTCNKKRKRKKMLLPDVLQRKMRTKERERDKQKNEEAMRKVQEDDLGQKEEKENIKLPNVLQGKMT